MALLFMDGFDSYSASINQYNIGKTSAQVASAGGHYFFAALSSSSPRYGSGQYVTGTQSANWYVNIPSVDTIVMGCAYYLSNYTSITNNDQGIIFDILESITVRHGMLKIKYTTHEIEYQNSAGTALATSSYVFPLTAWHYIELKVYIHDSAGTVDVQVDGVSIISATGLDTRNGGTGVITRAYFGSEYSLSSKYNSGNFWLDDVYVCDTSGSYCNDFLGDVRIETIRPTGDSSPLQFTPSTGSNYTCVDEAVISTTDYVSASTSGYRDQYAMSNLTGSVGTIHAVSVNAPSSKSDSGAIQGKVYVKSSSSEDLSGAFTPSLGSYLTLMTNISERDPNGTIAWTESAVNAMECGIEVV